MLAWPANVPPSTVGRAAAQGHVEMVLRRVAARTAIFRFKIVECRVPTTIAFTCTKDLELADAPRH